MKIFINDIPVYLVANDQAGRVDDYDEILDGREEAIKPVQMSGRVLIRHATPQNVDALLQLMTRKKLKSLDSLTFAAVRVKELKQFVKSTFRVIEAAGGLVRRQDDYLLIFRKGKWDLPKGKKDPGERNRETAVREVEEETGVKVAIEYKIGHTWHTYVQNKKFVLKKTHWYLMKCLSDHLMSPQEEEDIEQVKWMPLSEARQALARSYRSIQHVFERYLKKQAKVHKE